MTSTIDAVSERRREWIAAVNDGSMDAYADIVAADVVWLPPAGNPITNRDAFRAWLGPFLAQYDYRFLAEPTEVRAFKGWCAEVGNFRSELSPRTGGEAREHAGRYFVLWRRDTDGKWRIERYVDLGRNA